MKSRSIFVVSALLVTLLSACSGGDTKSTSDGGAGGMSTTTSSTTSTSSSTSSSTGGGGAGGSDIAVTLTTCGNCGSAMNIAPYDGDNGTMYFEDGDWAGVLLAHNKPVDVKSVTVEFTSGTFCAPVDTGVELKVLPSASTPPDANDSSMWGLSLPIPATDTTWVKDLASVIHLDSADQLAVAVQMQVKTHTERTCLIAYETDDMDTSKDLWFHHEAACDNAGQPAEDCGWKDLAISPIPNLGIPGHWAISVDAVETM